MGSLAELQDTNQKLTECKSLIAEITQHKNKDFVMTSDSLDRYTQAIELALQAGVKVPSSVRSTCAGLRLNMFLDCSQYQQWVDVIKSFGPDKELFPWSLSSPDQTRSRSSRSTRLQRWSY